jgi:hypothetical protein
MKKLFVCAALLALGACVEKPAALGPPIATSDAPGLSSAAILDVVNGNTGVGTMSGSNITYAMYIAPDGTAQTQLPTGIDTGNWRLTSDGQWCVNWKLFRNGEEYCQRVYRHGEGYKFVNGNSEELLTFAPGKRF